MILSIIIPVYNVEKYIEKCLNSCLNQNISFSDYEIIIINDGSKDRSLEISKQTALLYNNIKIISQENVGLSATRNKGLLLAQGDYIWFVDSDDTITDGALEAIFEGLKSKVDILGIQYRLVYDDVSLNRDVTGVNINGIKDGKQVIVNGGYSIPVQFNIYRRQFLLENKLFFAEGILHEDSEFKPKAIYLANNISTINYICYNYYKGNNDSITAKHTIRNVEGYIYAAESLNKFCRNVNQRCKHKIYQEVGRCVNGAIFSYINIQSKEQKEKSKIILLRTPSVFLSMIKSFKLKYIIEGLMLILFPSFFLRIYLNFKK